MPRQFTRVTLTCATCGKSFLRQRSMIPKSSRAYCSNECAAVRYKHQIGRPLIYTAKDYERMERHLDKSGDCWLYQGQPSQAYPNFKTWYEQRTPIKKRHAHVAAWEMFVGPIPDGMFVCHVCDNPRCCRTDEEGWHEVNGVLLPRRGHLFLGTPAMNQQDMAAKGRAYNGAPHGLAGESNPIHKLTADDVREIRRSYAAGEASQNQLAARFGVAQGIIWMVIHRRSWQHIE